VKSFKLHLNKEVQQFRYLLPMVLMFLFL